MCACVLLVAAPAWADPPDARVNPVSGAIETVDAAPQSGNLDIRHAINPGQGQPIEAGFVTTHPADDVSPRIAIGSNGDTWIAWWRDGATPAVLVRKRVHASGLWQAERTVGPGTQASRNPEIAFDGSTAWIGYEESTEAGVGIRCGEILDDTEPIATITLGTTSFTGDVDVVVHAESGSLWVTWVDGAAQVAWSKYDHATGTWSAPSVESYASDSVTAARGRIRTTVMGN